MSEQPPNYKDDKDVLEILPINSDALLLVRLEVWHYFKLGRSPILNHDLAQLFIALELANWTVKEVEIVEPKGLSSRDEFVPVQVSALSFHPLVSRKLGKENLFCSHD